MEGGDVSAMAEIINGTLAQVTAALGTLWSAIIGNAFLSFSVGVSAITAVIMLFKRLVGASRR